MDAQGTGEKPYKAALLGSDEDNCSGDEKPSQFPWYSLLKEGLISSAMIHAHTILNSKVTELNVSCSRHPGGDSPPVLDTGKATSQILCPVLGLSRYERH